MLDLSALKNLRKETGSKRNEATESPQTSEKGASHSVAPKEEIEGLKRTTEPINIEDIGKRYPKIYNKKKAEQHTRNVMNNFQDNVKKSERLRIEINKDIAGGKDKADILLKAIECIGLMTGDTAFTEMNTKRLMQK